MLTGKMDREMMKFSLVETAFKNIKIATGTTDTATMVEKFLNKESAYGELLSKIADEEKRIKGLKVEYEEREREGRRLEEEQGNLFQGGKKGGEDAPQQLASMAMPDSTYVLNGDIATVVERIVKRYPHKFAHLANARLACLMRESKRSEDEFSVDGSGGAFIRNDRERGIDSRFDAGVWFRRRWWDRMAAEIAALLIQLPLETDFFKVVEDDWPVAAVLEESRAGYDLVVIGADQSWGLEHRLFGAKAEVIIAQCPVSLLVLRQGSAAGERAEAPSEAAHAEVVVAAAGLRR